MTDIGSAFDGFFPALAIDLVAVAILAYAIYYRRHRRRDLLFAYVCFNVGLFAVVRAFMLADANMGTGLALGIGLFGALSIIRLRSEEISYAEVAYFFSALALAIVCGVGGERHSFALVTASILLAVLALMEAVRPRRVVSRMTVVLDHVLPEDTAVRAELERRLGGSVVGLNVVEVDYVRDLMRLEVQLESRPLAAASAVAAPAAEVTVAVER